MDSKRRGRDKTVTIKKVAEDMRNNSILKKLPGYDLIIGSVLQQLLRKYIVKLTNLINAAFRLKHVPSVWKIAEVIMIIKLGKPPNETSIDQFHCRQ